MTRKPTALARRPRIGDALARARRQRAEETFARTLAKLGIPADYGAVRQLPRMREPPTLVSIGLDLHGREQRLAPPAARAYARMQAAARADGVAFVVVSAFRSIAYQVALVERKLARGDDIARILAVSAAPGYSEHHAGRTVDLAETLADALEECFEATPSYAWLVANAAKFGFRLSYPRGNVHGIAYEPWHWTYVGQPG